MAIIGIDMDGTIADFTTLSFKNVEKTFGIKMTREDAYKPNTAELVWDRMTKKQKANYADKREIYKDVCPAGFFYEIKPLKGAVRAVNKIAKMGNEIIFITKPLDWKNSAPEKVEWLKKYFPDLKYRIIMVDDMHLKELIDVDVLIDDDPRALQQTLSVPMCIAQPWNENSRAGLNCVKDITEAAQRIKDLGPSLSEWYKND